MMFLEQTAKHFEKHHGGVKEPDHVDLGCLSVGKGMCMADFEDRSIWGVPHIGHCNSWWSLMAHSSVWVCVYVGVGCVCAVMGCESGDSVPNTCWGTSVASSIIEKIRKMSS